MGGVYSRNKLFDKQYIKGAQDLPALEKDIYVESATTASLFESYEDYIYGGWPEFIKDFCE